VKSTKRTQILAAAVAAAAAGLAPAAALATAPGTNGQIAFRRYLGPDRTKGAIFMAAPDGSGQRQITTPPAKTSDDYPDAASDGSFVAFQRCGRTCHVYAVRTDGTGLRRIGSGGVDRSYPAISPDRTRIAFIRTFGHLRPNRPPDHVAIYTIGIDGSGERRVTLSKPKTAEDVDPQWSPDGRRIVFVRMNGTARPRHGQAIFVVNADGTGLHRVTPWKLRAGDGPDWSPDGKEILFRSPETEDFLHCNLFTIHPDGTGLREVTHLAPETKLYSASFSPDGGFITFGQTGVDGQADVFTMRTDGSEVTPLTRSPQWDSAPDWGGTA
jgi:Tol biopolymer transport system component